MASSCITLLAITLFSASLLLSTTSIRAQQLPNCAANLAPCAEYLTTRYPPASCCGPLRQTIETQLECLCSLYNNPSLVQSFGINVTQSMELPKNCNITGSDTPLCSASAPAPTALLTPPPPPRGVPRSDGNGAGKMAWAGASGLLMFWVSIMAY